MHFFCVPHKESLLEDIFFCTTRRRSGRILDSIESETVLLPPFESYKSDYDNADSLAPPFLCKLQLRRRPSKSDSESAETALFLLVLLSLISLKPR